MSSILDKNRTNSLHKISLYKEKKDKLTYPINLNKFIPQTNHEFFDDPYHLYLLFSSHRHF